MRRFSATKRLRMLSHTTGMRADVSEYIRVMTQAMEMGGVKAEEIDSVNAHGSSTPMNDAVETRAIKEVFGARVHELPVNATKSMTGAPAQRRSCD